MKPHFAFLGLGLLGVAAALAWFSTRSPGPFDPGSFATGEMESGPAIESVRIDAVASSEFAQPMVESTPDRHVVQAVDPPGPTLKLRFVDHDGTPLSEVSAQVAVDDQAWNGAATLEPQGSDSAGRCAWSLPRELATRSLEVQYSWPRVIHHGQLEGRWRGQASQVEHEIRIPQGGRLFGRVSIGPDDAPVDSGELFFRWSRGEHLDGQSTVHFEGGCYELSFPVIGRVTKIGLWSEHLPSLSLEPADLQVADGAHESFDLRFADVLDVTLTFVDAGSEEPVSGVRLEQTVREDLASDEAGRIQLDRAMTAADGLLVRANHPEYELAVTHIQPEPGEIHVARTLRLERGCKIEGRTVNARGDALPDVGVKLVLDPYNDLYNVWMGFSRSARTDAEGRFTLQGLNQRPNYGIFFTSPDERTIAFGLAVVGDHIEREWTIPDPLTVWGSAVLADGRQAGAASVHAADPGGFNRRDAETESSGCFRLDDLWPGPWILSASQEACSAWMHAEIREEDLAPVRIELPAIGEDGARPSNSIAWRVIDGATGGPVGEASIHVQSTGATERGCSLRRTVTKSIGWLCLPAGEYEITAHSQEHGHARVTASVGGEKSQSELEFRLKR